MRHALRGLWNMGTCFLCPTEMWNVRRNGFQPDSGRFDGVEMGPRRMGGVPTRGKWRPNGWEAGPMARKGGNRYRDEAAGDGCAERGNCVGFHGEEPTGNEGYESNSCLFGWLAVPETKVQSSNSKFKESSTGQSPNKPPVDESMEPGHRSLELLLNFEL